MAGGNKCWPGISNRYEFLLILFFLYYNFRIKCVSVEQVSTVLKIFWRSLHEMDTSLLDLVPNGLIILSDSWQYQKEQWQLVVLTWKIILYFICYVSKNFHCLQPAWLFAFPVMNTVTKGTEKLNFDVPFTLPKYNNRGREWIFPMKLCN